MTQKHKLCISALTLVCRQQALPRKAGLFENRTQGYRWIRHRVQYLRRSTREPERKKVSVMMCHPLFVTRPIYFIYETEIN